jgi:methylmalonyl-CoA mutase N-terminal domain/subunit
MNRGRSIPWTRWAVLFTWKNLTDEIEKRAGEYIEKDRPQMGGSVSAIEKGYIQQEIQESSYRYQREIERGAGSWWGQ